MSDKDDADNELDDILNNGMPSNDDSEPSDDNQDIDSDTLAALAGQAESEADPQNPASESNSSDSSSASDVQPNTTLETDSGSKVGIHVQTSSESESEQSSVASAASSESSASSSAIEDKVNPKHMDSMYESNASEGMYHTKSQTASSEMSSAFNPVDRQKARDDVNMNATDVDHANSAISDYNKKAKKQGLVDDGQIADMKAFCDDIKQVVVNFSKEYDYDMGKLTAQSTALYDNMNAIETGHKPDDVKQLQLWMETGIPQQMTKLTKQMAKVVYDPRFQAFLKTDNKETHNGKTVKKTKPIDSEDRKQWKHFNDIGTKFTKQMSDKNKDNEASDSDGKDNDNE